MAQIDQSVESASNLETPLKELLDKILDYAAKFFTTKEDLALLESKLEDYENNLDLIRVMTECFSVVSTKIDEKLTAYEGADYDELEKVVQKHESEIRNHIRIEQQMKLYADSIQAKLDEVEKGNSSVLEQTKNLLNDTKKENLKLTESMKQKNEDLERLTAQVKILESQNHDFKIKLQEVPVLQERINQLMKKETPPNLLIHRNSSNSAFDSEGQKKIDTEGELSKSNLELTKKSLKILSTNASSVKFTKKALPYGASTLNKSSKDSTRIKVEAPENKYRKDLEMLKSSYQKFYNPNKNSTRNSEQERERDARRKSMSRIRELKATYNIPIGIQTSNSSLIQINQNFSHRDMSLQKLHQRSNSHASRNKSGSSFVKVGEM